MLKRRFVPMVILMGILGIVLPMGFDLGSSALISFGFGTAFSLLRWNAKLVKNYC